MKNKKYVMVGMEIAKWGVLVLMVVLIYALVFSKGHVSQAEFSQVAEAVGNAAQLEDVQEGNNQIVKRLYGLDPAELEGAYLLYPTSNMGAQEVLVVKIKELSQQDMVKEAMEQRAQSQMDVFEGYAPIQYGILEQSVIEVQGNYILFVSAEDTAPIRRAFMDAL